MKYLTPNWSAINKAISAGDLKELREEERSVKKKIQDKIDAHFKAKREAEAAQKIANLKALKAGEPVYYTGHSCEIFFGTTGVKISDGRTRMVADFAGKKWSVYYTNLQTIPLTAEEKSNRKISNRIGEILTGKL